MNLEPDDIISPPDWKAIFRKSEHEFSDLEIELAGLDDTAVLVKSCPKFWKAYQVGERNNKNLQDIWDLEYEWYNEIKAQNFPKAKRLYLQLIRVKI